MFLGLNNYKGVSCRLFLLVPPVTNVCPTSHNKKKFFYGFYVGNHFKSS